MNKQFQKLKRLIEQDIQRSKAEGQRRQEAGDEAAHRELVGWVQAMHEVLDKMALLEREPDDT